MEILINGKLAALKKGTSFEYVSENRLFSGSDGYSLTIAFPLRGCPENIEIFGHINRADVVAGTVVFNCEIREKSFILSGSITITEINEAEVKTQFLEGRSEQNFDRTFDKIYVNELDLGQPDITDPAQIKPHIAWVPVYNSFKCVALPWVNNNSDSGLIHNLVEYAGGSYQWAAETSRLSWQPMLLYITRKICEAVGYQPELSQLEAVEEYRYYVICNTLPPSWGMPGFASALPHWTVEEYFEKLELFLGGEFSIDHRNKRISFAFSRDVLEKAAPVLLDDVIEEHSTEVAVDDASCDYIDTKNIAYKDPGYPMWKYYSCDWFIPKTRPADGYDNLAALLDATRSLASGTGSSGRGSSYNKKLYVKDIDTFFIIRAVSRQFSHTLPDQVNGDKNVYLYKYVLQPLNNLGPRVIDHSDDADELEVEFIPACIDYTDDEHGFCLFLDFSGYDDSTNSSSGDDWQDTAVDARLKAGEKEKKEEFYSCVYVAYWNGSVLEPGKLPHPYSENIAIKEDWSGFAMPGFSMRLNDPSRSRIVHNIDPKKRSIFKFIANEIPDVRAVFIIRGKRYICEKLTATFTEKGMSQLIKGEFYPIL